MTSRTVTRRSFGALVAGALVAGLAACSGGSDDTSAAAAPTTATGGTFPVTVKHLWGETTVPSEPQRVVVLGVTDADAVLALGVTPVAVMPFFDYASGVGPWAEDLVAGKDIQVLPAGSDTNVELVASLRPDLIIAVSSGFEESVYTQLAELAPTLVRPEGARAYGVSRADATRSIATVLGRGDQADGLLATADAAFTEARAANPGFVGATGTVVLPYDGKYGAYLPEDARGQIMDQLGFVLPTTVSDLDDGSSFFVELSSERLDVLEGDVLVVLTDETSKPVVEADQVLQNLTVTKDGGLVLPDAALRGAMSYNSVLSAPYAARQLAPLLAKALPA